MDRDQFDVIVRETIDAMPARIRAALENFQILVVDEPGDEPGTDDTGELPDAIYLNRREHVARGLSQGDVRLEIAKTLVRQVAYYFGIDDEQLDDVGWGNLSGGRGNMNLSRSMSLIASLLPAELGSSLPKKIALPAEQLALPAATDGLLSEFNSSIYENHSSDHSGFRLLDKNADALTFRLALIDEAVSSLDLMYYLWYADDSGNLLLSRVIEAADRGVKVRLLVDDLLQFGNDKVLVALHEHASMQIRIFNPWRSRETGRSVEFVKNVDRLNIRMHNKVMIADNHATILGGRNIGDSYFGLSGEYNFRDVDVLGIGTVARQASDMFDEFWNSGWVVSASDLPQEADEGFYATWLEKLGDSLQSADSLAEFALEQQNWTDQLSRIARDMTFAKSEFVFDAFNDDEIVGGVARPLDQILQSAESEILLVNAYLIPNQELVDRIESSTSQGVHVHILTNSLASHDVPAVNSHYQKWRRPVIDAGAKLFELRCDPAIKSRVDTPPVSSQFTTLHTKVLVVDRQRVFIGSMNFDPRSANINTEMGVIIESPGLGMEMAELAIRDSAPENAWQVKLDDEGNVTWENLEETVTQQPARSPWQRVMDGFFKIMPESQI